MSKKLIEVALPLEAINRESADEKSIRNHPSTLHLWWSRKPLAVCRAVLFASLVDDPSSHPEEFPTEKAQEDERQRLFKVIEDLVMWENTTNEKFLNTARAEISRSTAKSPPPILDPFCGGGSIPFEAQRLGLEAHASDLNPVAVLITKAVVEIPPKFAGRPPINSEARKKLDYSKSWRGAEGLSEDVRYYGKWMRDEAEKRIGHLYPRIRLPKELGNEEATVVAWLYCRAVRCPNPACGAWMPLATKFWLATKSSPKVWVEPAVDSKNRTVLFNVKVGEPDKHEASVIGLGSCFLNEKRKKVKATFKCLSCNEGIAKGQYIDYEASNGRMISLPMAIVSKKPRGRCYLNFDQAQLSAATEQASEYLTRSGLQANVPTEPAHGTFASNAQGRVYGFKTFADYFTRRQLVALTTLCSLAGEVCKLVQADARSSGIDDDARRLADGGTGATAYAGAVSTYLALAIDRIVMTGNSLVRWNPVGEKAQHSFGRQAIPMIWDFAEPNLLADATGSISAAIDLVADPLINFGGRPGVVTQLDATAAMNGIDSPLISTDPPYYDNVGYSNLSDFFYVWLRRSLGSVFPDIFATLLTPKEQELVATPFRFDGDKALAGQFFESGLARVFVKMREVQNPEYPLTIYYAFKQSEETEAEEDEYQSDISSTGWETMLTGLISAGFAITGTWPMRTEMKTRQVAMGTNALSTSVVLVCRQRSEAASLGTRRDFLKALKQELPQALRHLQQGFIAPVDLAQAAIGPGMAVFSRYSKLLEADGTPMTVRTALALINQGLDEVLAEQESEFDADTRWALAWFEQFGMDEASFGVAETLSKAKNTAVNSLVGAGILAAKSGKVRLLKRKEMPTDWNPAGEQRLTIWEVAQHLIRALEDGGEVRAAALLRKLGSVGETARDLAYRLYSLCERNKWPQEALAYNSLVIAWPEIARLAKSDKPSEQQATLNL